MTRWILVPSLFTLIALASAAACGGNVLHVGNDVGDGGAGSDAEEPRGIPEAGSPGYPFDTGLWDASPDGPVPITLPDGALPPGVLAAIPFPSSKVDYFRGIVGTSASDLWCFGRGDGTHRSSDRLQLLHWDGGSWSVVNLPAPLAYTKDVFGASPVAPGVVWVASALGVARMHADGTTESFTAPGFDGTGVALSVAVAQVGSDAFLSRDGRLFQLDGTAFHDITPPDLPQIEGMEGSGDALWIWAKDGLVARKSGSSWVTTHPFASSEWTLHTFSDGKFWGIPGPSEPLYVGLSTSSQVQPWHLWSVDTIGVVGQLEVDPPADVPHAGSASYNGSTVLTNAAGKLAYVACATPAQGGAPHLVIHEGTGSTLGPARSLPDSLGCAVATHPLTDGTWAFLRGDQYGWSPDTFVLVSP